MRDPIIRDQSIGARSPDLGQGDDMGERLDIDVMPDLDTPDLDMPDQDLNRCAEPSACTPEGLWRRCEEGEVVESMCPDDMRCDPDRGRCMPIEVECEEGVTLCSGLTDVLICVEGMYSAPEPCPEGTQCTAGRCLSACERAQVSADYQGCEFWAADLDNILDGSGEGPGASPSAVVLSHLGARVAEVMVSDAQGVIAHQAQLQPGETQSFILPRSDQVGTRISAAAWRVETSEPVLAYQLSPLQREGTSSVDATLLIPTAGLDDSYRVLTWPGQGYNQRGFLSIIATAEAPTTVSLIIAGEASSGVDLRGEMQSTAPRKLTLRPGEAWTETLERGELLNLQSGPFADLSGSLIIADQDIAVFAGTRCSNIPAGIPRCDHLEHQMLPLRNQGSRYIAPGGFPRADELTYYRVVAAFDQTEITLTPDRTASSSPNPEMTPIILNAGDVTTLSAASPFLIESNAPIMVGMFLASADAGALGVGDPSMVLLPPVAQLRDEYAFLTPYDFVRDGLTLFARGEAQLSLDQTPLTVAWTQVGETEWWVAHTEIADGPHRLSADRPLGVIASGYDEEVSYAFTGGMRLEKLREAEPPPLDQVCLGGAALGTPCESGVEGVCAAGRITCEPEGEPRCAPIEAPSVERCNQLDDDCDGLIDEADCADFNLERVTPSADRFVGIEGEALDFSVNPVGAAVGLEIQWFVDDDLFVGESDPTLTWTPLGFEEGARVVTAQVTDGQRVAERQWLVLINDSPSNTAVIWGRVTLPSGEVVPDVSLKLRGGISESVSVTDPRGFYALPAEPDEYQVQVDSVFMSAPAWFPTGVITLITGVELDRLNQRRDLELPIARVTGVVTDESGTPLSGTQLDFNGDCFACRSAIAADELGAYEVALYYGEWSVEATPPASYQLPTRVITGETVAEDRRWDIIFPSVYQIEALVIDQYNTPTAGVTILFEGEEAEVVAQSDSAGMITARLTRDTYKVLLDTVFYPRPPQIGHGRVTLIDALVVESDLETFSLPLPNAWVSGVVTGAGEGATQAGVEISFDGTCFACRGTTSSDAQGAYALPLLHSDYEVELSPPAESAYVNQSGLDVPVFADLTHPITLEGPALIVSGTLSDPRGQPVVGLTVKSVGRTEAASVTDVDGRFVLRLLSGEYTLKLDTVFAPRPEGAPRGVVSIWTGAVEVDQALTLIAPYSYVTGRAQEAAGDVIPSLTLEFNGACFACSQRASTDTEGQYATIVFQSVYTVTATPPAPLPQILLEDVDCTQVETTLNIDY